MHFLFSLLSTALGVLYIVGLLEFSTALHGMDDGKCISAFKGDRRQNNRQNQETSNVYIKISPFLVQADVSS